MLFTPNYSPTIWIQQLKFSYLVSLFEFVATVATSGIICCYCLSASKFQLLHVQRWHSAPIGWNELLVPSVSHADFIFYAPFICNKLLDHCNAAETFNSFKSRLKTLIIAGMSYALNVLCVVSLILCFMLLLFLLFYHTIPYIPYHFYLYNTLKHGNTADQSAGQ